MKCTCDDELLRLQHVELLLRHTCTPTFTTVVNLLSIRITQSGQFDVLYFFIEYIDTIHIWLSYYLETIHIQLYNFKKKSCGFNRNKAQDFGAAKSMQDITSQRISSCSWQKKTMYNDLPAIQSTIFGQWIVVLSQLKQVLYDGIF